MFWLEKTLISPPKASTPLEDPPKEFLNDPLNDKEPPLNDNELLAPLSISSGPLPFRTLPPKATLSFFRLDFLISFPPLSTNLGFLTPLPTLLVTLDPFSYLNSFGIPLRGLNNNLNLRVLSPGLSKCRVIP